ncbi:hypothetical protein Ddye_018187 [Dipteronia dyeriana]|uniref:Uncharacterized protein n=1 Tax=Dipteronia dyeriana TaxID=168575 RepID=A0AAD9UAM7_9ROSI|nr:hypothetical protein Ddye_018187 [Dipteronia dyeriana]
MRNDTHAYILLPCLIRQCREQKLVSWMPYHAVFGFLIPLLVAVLQLTSNPNITTLAMNNSPASSLSSRDLCLQLR